jgi:hypothetical protein
MIHCGDVILVYCPSQIRMATSTPYLHRELLHMYFALQLPLEIP